MQVYGVVFEREFELRNAFGADQARTLFLMLDDLNGIAQSVEVGSLTDFDNGHLDAVSEVERTSPDLDGASWFEACEKVQESWPERWFDPADGLARLSVLLEEIGDRLSDEADDDLESLAEALGALRGDLESAKSAGVRFQMRMA